MPGCVRAEPKTATPLIWESVSKPSTNSPMMRKIRQVSFTAKSSIGSRRGSKLYSLSRFGDDNGPWLVAAPSGGGTPQVGSGVTGSCRRSRVMGRPALLASLAVAALGTGCLVQIDHVADPGPEFRRARAEALRIAGTGHPHEVNVLAYDADERELVRVTVPLWLVKKAQRHV